MMLDSNRTTKRIEILMLSAGLVLLVFVGQLINLQVFHYKFYKNRAQKQSLESVKQQIGRGTIYTADGREAAVSMKSYSITANPGRVRNKAAVADFLARATGGSRAEIYGKLRSGKDFVYLARKVDADRAGAVIEKNFAGIYPVLEEKRYYPLKETAGHITGFSGTDNIGLEGVEKAYEKYLRGKMGTVLVRRDAKGRKISLDSIAVKKAEAGADLYLTIDSNIQSYCAGELARTAEKYRAKAGMAIVMKPETGEILALANYPTYDPNEFSRYGNEALRNRIVTDMFEPGSTFKIFTMAAILKDRPGAYNEKVHCGDGKQYFFDRYVRDHEGHGWLTVPEVIKYSSNIGMVNLAMRVKPAKLYSEYACFGFGEKTGIDLPGEAQGILRTVDKWNNATLASIPYGQEVAVTGMQLARAYAALANGGYMVKPYIVDRIEKDGRTVYRHKAEKSGRVIDNGTREKLVKMLETVCEPDGTGKKAAITGYTVAGKTGTAQKHSQGGRGYAYNKYISTFIGFLPAEKPEVLAMYMLDEPDPIFQYGGDTAAPAFRNLSNMMISYLHILPDGGVSQAAVKSKDAPEETKQENVVLPDFQMKRYSEARRFFTEREIKHTRVGFGRTVISQWPEPGKTVGPNDRITVFLGDVTKTNETRIYVPDLRGCTLRKAIDILEVYGLKAKCSGSGVAISQAPKPGVAVKKGGVVVISFESKDKT
ncbi:MAG: PASTA domain-containing protein [Spirochaetia bacterium]|nr:PASTA domain-containing protein [Spirochaetia bacterium]